MSQRTFWFAAILVLLLLGVTASTLVLLVRWEPAWYAAAAAMPPGPKRTEESKKVLKEISYFGEDAEPFVSFKDTEINNFLEEDFVKIHPNRPPLPDSISQPRVAFDQNHIKVGFRYGNGLWSSIVTINLRVWLPEREPNVVALKVEGFRAGALPISEKSLLEQLAEVGRKNNIDVNWYRVQGCPVALIRFQPDQPRPTFQLKVLRLLEHSITVQWQSLDSDGVRPPDSSAKPAVTGS